MRASAAAAVALLAACVTREPDTRPFRIEAVRAGVGPVEAGITQPTSVAFDGTLHRQDDTTLTLALDGSGQLLTFTFRRDGAPDVAFPAQLDGQHGQVVVDIDPTHGGPEGEPLPIHGLLVATGTAADFHYQFILGEFSSAQSTGIALQPTAVNTDAPWFSSVNDWAQLEPSSCGPVYYDVLQVIGSSGTITLRTGDQGQLSIGTGQPPWKALNAMSWHRSDGCGAKPKAWTQLAAWR